MSWLSYLMIGSGTMMLANGIWLSVAAWRLNRIGTRCEWITAAVAKSYGPLALVRLERRSTMSSLSAPMAGRGSLWLLAALVAIPSASFGQESAAPAVQLPPLHVEAVPESCVDVEVEGARSLSYDCLNKNLKDAAGNAAVGPHPFDVKDAAGNGAPTTVGTFSYTGTSIRMGSNFGKSAFPQRPQPPSFTNALISPGAK
ncbi:MAG TPA: hypothetical protein VGM68_06785 [Rhizomicrobium sp.]|jgi:hypothetical protein